MTIEKKTCVDLNVSQITWRVDLYESFPVMRVAKSALLNQMHARNP